MSKPKGIFIGAGWNKTSKEGTKFISAQGGNKSNKSEIKLFAVDENGEQFEVKYFSIFKNKTEDRKPNSPDYFMVYFPHES